MRLKPLLVSILPAAAIAATMVGEASRPTAAQAPAQGNPGTPVSAAATRFGTSPAVRDLPPVPKAALSSQPYRLQIEPGDPRTVNPSVAPDRDAAVQDYMPAPLIPAPSLTFDGVAATDNTAAYGFTVAPPDTNGDVGPNHYVQYVNLLARVYNKAGAPLTAPFKLSSLFVNVGGICATNNNGDPQALYDPIADRWLLAQFAFTGISSPPYHMCMAVSQTPDPTGAYFVYDFTTPGTEFPDYPKLGVWPDGYYMTVNQFNNGGPFDGTGAYAFNRTKMLAGQAANFIYFNLNLALHPEGIGGALPSDIDGTALPAAGSPNVFSYFLATEFGDAIDGLRLFNFHADFTVPANSTFTERAESPIATAAFAPFTSRVPQLNSTSPLDVLGDRLMHRMQYRKIGTTECLTTNHTVAVGIVAAPRWHTLCKASSTGPYSFATAPGGEGTFSPDSTHRWMGSAALDKQGNLAVGFSASSSSIFPQIRYAGRLVTDPAGQLSQGEAHMFDGTGSQTDTVNRWGDYSMLAVDPSDDCTFWFTTEYYGTTSQFNWKTRIGKFAFTECTGGGGQQPDLIVSKLSAPAKSGAGANITIKDTTTNQGAGGAPATNTVFFLSTNNVLDGGDTQLGSRSVPALAAGASSAGSASVTIPANTAPGKYFLIAKADGTNVATESNENNNTRTKAITIGPDLRVTALSAPASATHGTQITISDTTKNVGGASTGVGTVTRFFLSVNTSTAGAVVLGSRNVPVLGANGASSANTIVTIPAGTAPGAYRIIAVADATNAVVEVLESNNKRNVSITIN